MLDTYIKWFESHERLLIVALVMGLGVYGWNHYVDKTVESDKAKASILAQVADAQKEQDAKNAALVAQLQANFNQQQAQRDQEIASLVSAIAQRDRVASTKIDQIKQITNQNDAIQALVNTYPSLPAVMTVTADGADVPVENLKVFAETKVTLDAAQGDLIDTQKQLSTEKVAFDQLAGLNGGLGEQVDGLKAEITKNAAQCEGDKKTLRDEARKSRWHTFWWGYGAGFVSREALKIFTGR